MMFIFSLNIFSKYPFIYLIYSYIYIYSNLDFTGLLRLDFLDLLKYLELKTIASWFKLVEQFNMEDTFLYHGHQLFFKNRKLLIHNVLFHLLRNVDKISYVTQN